MWQARRSRGGPAAQWRDRRARAKSSLVFLEISQIRRRLVFLCRHEQPVGTQIVGLFANRHVGVIFGAHVLAPPDRLVGDDAMIVPRDHPWARQGIVNGGNLVMKQVRVGAVEKDALADNGPVVAMERDAAGVIGAGAL